jgi:hypothetical protein
MTKANLIRLMGYAILHFNLLVWCNMNGETMLAELLRRQDNLVSHRIETLR